MSAPLSKELRAKYNVKRVPVHKDDEVMVVRGNFKNREGKVIACYRKKYVIHIERLTREKANGATVPIGVNASNCVITKLKINKDRKELLERRGKSREMALLKLQRTRRTTETKTEVNMAGVD
eukprot:CAMPEP_0171452598 /NCGR_PEP_ID=MMETSP0945-20130129/639_1 /TAXON_ID=109269 /ORGANISM="Vaucheria litorea, Strain CCMP2940" /LENGTH=122 /DNA_ID=CAMNT_0011977291 /DNA_START=125 /DNA_END=493 /DNA_ORIENTATION=+